MKSMPYKLKQKLRQYHNAVKKSQSIHYEINDELEKYNVPYDNLVANVDIYSDEPRTESLAFITNGEGEIEKEIKEIENVFLYFVNKNMS